MTIVQNSEFKTQNYNVKPKNELKTRSFEFSLKMIKLVSSFPEKRVYWVIGDQLLCCATSIGANIVEAKSSSSRKEFIKYFEIALKSANETTYWLLLLREGELIGKDSCNNLLAEVDQIIRMLASSLLTLKGKNPKVFSSHSEF